MKILISRKISEEINQKRINFNKFRANLILIRNRNVKKNTS